MEKKLSQREILKLIGLVSSIPVLSACDRMINLSPVDFTDEITPITSSFYTPESQQMLTQAPTPELTLTPTATETATPTVTPTETKVPAENVWQLSPDGYVYYNEAELYDGLFTINKEHPEWVEKYWEDTVSSLWNLNFAGQNKVFISQYTTADSLVNYLKGGGETVYNLWIPVKYPDASMRYWSAETLVPTGPVNLTKIALSIYKPTREEIFKFSKSYDYTKYIAYIGKSGAAGEVLIEQVVLEDDNVLKFTFRSDILMDDVVPEQADGSISYLRHALSESKNAEDNLKSANQIIQYWLLMTQILKDNPDRGIGALAIHHDGTPNVLNLNAVLPTSEEFDAFYTTENSPLAIR